MANTVITSNGDRINIVFNDDFNISKQRQVTCHKSVVSLDFSKSGDSVSITILGASTYNSSFSGSINNTIKIDSVNGVAPVSNSNLYTMLESIISIDNTKSNLIVSSQMSNTNVATLVTNVNSYLSGSTKRFVSVDYEVTGTITPTFYAFITESNQ